MRFNFLPKSNPVEILDYEKELGHELVVNERETCDPCMRYYVMFEHSDRKDGCMLIGEYGNGATIDAALIDYCKLISGKTIVFNACSFGDRKTIKMPNLVHTKKVLLHR